MAEENKQEEVIQYEEFEENDQLDFYYLKAKNTLKKIDNMDFPKYYFDVVNAGDNKFYQKNITETKQFDETWVKTLEGFFPSIDKIIKNPKLSIRYEEEVVPIEKAKKTNSASVRHLASHTQLIKEIDERGNVRPKKILNTFAEEEIATYENRFIMTLINRVFFFVRARLEIIKQNVESYQNDHLYYVSNFDILDEQVEFKIDVNIKRDLDNKAINKQNHELLARVERLMLLVNGFRNSSFMKAMVKAKKVNPPIMKTNIILKNPDFKNAYALWLFLDRYSSLGYDIDVRERPVRLSAEFKTNLDHISAFAYAALINNKHKRQEDFRVIESIEPVTKKSTKVVKTLVEDVVKRPDEIIVEDTLINEYYLQLNKKQVTNTIKELVKDKVTKEAAAKKVVKESIQITNAMFDTVFEIEENIDFFEKYINEEDPIEKYNDAKYKVKIAKVIREAKEADYSKSIKLEKSLYKTMLKAANARLKKVNEQRRDEAFAKFEKQLDKEAKALQKEKVKLKELIKKLDGKLVDVETGKQQIVLEKEQFETSLKEEIETLNAKLKQELKEDLDKVKKAHKEDVAKQKAEMKESLKAAEKRKADRQAKMKEKRETAIQKEKAKALEQKTKQLAQREEIHNAELEKLELEKQQVLEQIKAIDGKVIDETTGKDELTLEKEKLAEQIQADKDIIKSVVEEETALELAKIQKEHEEKIAKLKAEFEQQIEAAKKRRIERIAKFEEKHQLELDKEENKQLDKKQKTIEKQISKNQKEEQALIDKYEQQLKEINKPLEAVVEVESANGEIVSALVVESKEDIGNE